MMTDYDINYSDHMYWYMPRHAMTWLDMIQCNVLSFAVWSDVMWYASTCLNCVKVLIINVIIFCIISIVLIFSSISCRSSPYPILSFLILSYPILPYLTLSYLTLSYRTLSYLIFFYLIKSILFCFFNVFSWIYRCGYSCELWLDIFFSFNLKRI